MTKNCTEAILLTIVQLEAQHKSTYQTKPLIKVAWTEQVYLIRYKVKLQFYLDVTKPRRSLPVIAHNSLVLHFNLVSDPKSYKPFR